MNKVFLVLTLFSGLFFFSIAPASAHHTHYYGCGHSGYGIRYSPVYRVDYWHDHFAGRSYVRCHFYGGIHHFSAYRPVYRNPDYRNNQYYGRRYAPYRYYEGRQYYGKYYRPRTGFYFGISIH